MADIAKILNDIANGHVNMSDQKSIQNWCKEASDYIHELRTVTYVCHTDCDVEMVGTYNECQSHKDASPLRNWKINSVEDYGRYCYDEGYENADVKTADW